MDFVVLARGCPEVTAWTTAQQSASPTSLMAAVSVKDAPSSQKPQKQMWSYQELLRHAWQPVRRHGPAFGTNAPQEEDGSDPLCEVLAVNGRRCSLIDRNDVLCRHVTGAVPTAASPCMVLSP